MSIGIGIGVRWPKQSSLVPGLIKNIRARSTYFENNTCTTATLRKLENCKS